MTDPSDIPSPSTTAVPTATAAVFVAPQRPLELIDFDIPRPAAGEAVVAVDCCTVCGSDVHTWTGGRSGPAPSILGHEIVGRISAIGDGPPPTDVDGRPLTIGDRVTWAVVAACGNCEPCRRGYPQKCVSAWKYGHQATTDVRSGRASPLSGGLATHCQLVAGTAIVRVPDAVEDELASTASCAGATICGALRLAGDLSGKRVLVTGVGMLGLFACAMASDRGAAAVVAVDANADRLQWATSLGAGDVIRTDEGADWPAEARGTAGDFDILLECTGHPGVTGQALGLLGLGGTAVLIGATYPQSAVSVDAEMMVRRLLTVVGTHNYVPADLAAAMSFLSAKATLPALRSLVGPAISLSDVTQWRTLAEQGRFARVAVCPRT